MLNSISLWLSDGLTSVPLVPFSFSNGTPTFKKNVSHEYNWKVE